MSEIRVPPPVASPDDPAALSRGGRRRDRNGHLLAPVAVTERYATVDPTAMAGLLMHSVSLAQPAPGSTEWTGTVWRLTDAHIAARLGLTERGVRAANARLAAAGMMTTGKTGRRRASGQHAAAERTITLPLVDSEGRTGRVKVTDDLLTHDPRAVAAWLILRTLAGDSDAVKAYSLRWMAGRFLGDSERHKVLARWIALAVEAGIVAEGTLGHPDKPRPRRALDVRVSEPPALSDTRPPALDRPTRRDTTREPTPTATPFGGHLHFVQPTPEKDEAARDAVAASLHERHLLARALRESMKDDHAVMEALDDLEQAASARWPEDGLARLDVVAAVALTVRDGSEMWGPPVNLHRALWIAADRIEGVQPDTGPTVEVRRASYAGWVVLEHAWQHLGIGVSGDHDPVDLLRVGHHALDPLFSPVKPEPSRRPTPQPRTRRLQPAVGGWF